MSEAAVSTTAASVAPTGDTGSSASPNPSGDWMTGFNDETKGYVQNKGFKGPGDVIESYRNFEKLHGVPKERLLKLPEKDDAPEWNEIYDRLGRPKDAKEYQIKAPEGIQGDEQFAEFSRKTFHELGLTKKQGETLAAKWTEYAVGRAKAEGEQSQAKISQETESLKKEWGAAHDQNINVAKQGAREFGVSPEIIDQLEKQMGYSGVMKFFHNIGSKLGQHKFETGDGAKGFGAMTPMQAQQKINDLKGDSAFRERLTKGDVAARSEWDQLHAWGYPTQG